MSLTDSEYQEFSEMMEEIELHQKRLSDWELKFYNDQKERHEEYKERIRVSPKQMAVIRRMYEKVTDVA